MSRRVELSTRLSGEHARRRADEERRQGEPDRKPKQLDRASSRCVNRCINSSSIGPHNYTLDHGPGSGEPAPWDLGRQQLGRMEQARSGVKPRLAATRQERDL